jgi:hypothetical protein
VQDGRRGVRPGAATRLAKWLRGLKLNELRQAEGNALLARFATLRAPVGDRLLESMLSLLGKTRRIGPLDVDGEASAARRALQIQGDTGISHEATVCGLYSERTLASLEWG